MIFAFVHELEKKTYTRGGIRKPIWVLHVEDGEHRYEIAAFERAISRIGPLLETEPLLCLLAKPNPKSDGLILEAALPLEEMLSDWVDVCCIEIKESLSKAMNRLDLITSRSGSTEVWINYGGDTFLREGKVDLTPTTMRKLRSLGKVVLF